LKFVRAFDLLFVASAEAISVFAHPDGDHMTLLNVFRGFANAVPHDVYRSHLSSKFKNVQYSAARSWCDEHFLSLKVLERAAEIRTRLSGMLHTFLLGENSSEQRIKLSSSLGLPNESVLIRRFVYPLCDKIYCEYFHNAIFVYIPHHFRCLIQGYFSNVAQLGAGGRFVKDNISIRVYFQFK
jgi:hypothetical protein